MLNQGELLTLIDTCLDRQMTFSEIITQVEIRTGLRTIMAADAAVVSMKESKHPAALVMLHRIKEHIRRYNDLTLPLPA